jgi:outer membrane protein TolC
VRHTPAEGPVPETYSINEDLTGVEWANRWWEEFGSEELNELVDEALASNLTLRQAWARLDQAHAIGIQAAADLYPQLSFDGGASYDRTRRTIEGVEGPSWQEQLRDAAVSGVTQGLSQAITGSTTGGGAAGASFSSSETPASRITTEAQRFSLALAASYEVDLWGGYRHRRGRLTTIFRPRKMISSLSR